MNWELFRTRALLLLVSSLSCSSLAACTKTEVTRGPNGLLRLECSRGMKDCVSQAEKHCNLKDSEAGYTVVGGESRKVILGAEGGQYRKASEVARLEVICGARKAEESLYVLPARNDQEEDPDEEVSSAPLPSSGVQPVCVKGSTQACVGPGACQGGQVCLADGSGFAACDCGTSQSSAAPPASGNTNSPSIVRDAVPERGQLPLRPDADRLAPASPQ